MALGLLQLSLITVIVIQLTSSVDGRGLMEMWKKEIDSEPIDARQEQETACQRAVAEAIRGTETENGDIMIGAYIPQCDENGEYRPRQTWGSTGYSWCVTREGIEIPGTRTPPGIQGPTCSPFTDPAEETACERALADAIRETQPVNGRPIIGGYIPQCDDDGEYTPRQVHGGTGYSWCVTREGIEIPGTRTPPGIHGPTCSPFTDPAEETACQRAAAEAIRESQPVNGVPIAGAYIPQCDEDGEYRPLQHHGSTGHSWCVTREGIEIPGTRTPPGQPFPNCSPIAEKRGHQETVKNSEPVDYYYYY